MLMREHVIGAAETPVPSLLVDSAARFPDRVALRFGDAALAYAEIADAALRVATALGAHGIGAGARVGLLLPNHPAFVATFYGALAAGAAAVCMNPLYAEPALVQQGRDAELALIATLDQPEMRAKAEAAAAACGARLMLCAADGAEVMGHRRTAAAGAGALRRLSDALAAAPLARDAAPVRAGDIAVLQYTGGTTGSPKGAVLTHANLTHNVAQLRAIWTKLVPGGEVFAAAAPFSHITGLNVVLNLGIAMAATIDILPRFMPAAAAARMERTGATFFVGVPTMYVALLDAPECNAIDWRRFKYLVSGGAPLPLELARRFESGFGVRIVQGYGLSECSPGVSVVPAEGPVSEGSVGRVLAGTRVEIRSAADPGRAVPQGEIGEICVSGPQVTGGYWRREAENAAAFVNGVFRTGDLGYLDKDGFLHIADRLKDVIIAGGYNVYPTRVEDALYRHPAILEAAVVGVPDRYRGETVKAYVALRAGASLTLAELARFLAPLLSPMEIPKLLEILPALPKTAVGKISRLALRAPSSRPA